MRRSPAIFSVYMLATTQQRLVTSPRDPGVAKLHVNAGHFSTTARRVTSPTRGPPPPCKQALRHKMFKFSSLLIWYVFAELEIPFLE